MYISPDAPWFTFIVHPRAMADLRRLRAIRFLYRYSSSEDEVGQKACTLPPLVAGDIVFGTSAVKGELISVMRLPDAMMNASSGRDVLQGVEVALQRGTRVIGLGALTAPATGGGLTLVRYLPRGVTLTNGNSYTAAVVRRNVLEAAAALGINEQARVAVIGCTGSVGVTVSHLLAQSGFALTLLGRSMERLQQQLSSLVERATCGSELAMARKADIVVVLTSDPSARLMPDHVSAGSIIIDCAQPANIDPKGYDAFWRHGITVVEGGIVRIPGLVCTYDFGLSGPEDAFGCLAETYLFAKAGIHHHSVGYPSAEFACQMEQIAQKLGIYPRPLGLNAAISSSQTAGAPRA